MAHVSRAVHTHMPCGLACTAPVCPTPAAQSTAQHATNACRSPSTQPRPVLTRYAVSALRHRHKRHCSTSQQEGRGIHTRTQRALNHPSRTHHCAPVKLCCTLPCDAMHNRLLLALHTTPCQSPPACMQPNQTKSQPAKVSPPRHSPSHPCTNLHHTLYRDVTGLFTDSKKRKSCRRAWCQQAGALELHGHRNTHHSCTHTLRHPEPLLCCCDTTAHTLHTCIIGQPHSSQGCCCGGTCIRQKPRCYWDDHKHATSG